MGVLRQRYLPPMGGRPNVCRNGAPLVTP